MTWKNKSRNFNGGVRKEQKKLNPFEVHINRSKHQVLGRKLKSDRGLPGVSKNKALMKRKNTLLQEYKLRGKNNQFIDQRIGERNKNMTEDDRIMARFAAERMRLFNKKAMFNLSDTEVLTHKGQTLSEIERFEDTRSDDEEDDEGRRSSGALKGKFIESAHFGGGMFTKSKQDRESLIDELINESKKRKAERQRNKEETLEATEQLDEEWKTLGMIVTSAKDAGDINNQKKDQYDIVMRQLKFEPHGQPSQRLKTEEEIAKEDKEQLEKLEKERLKQLREIEMNKYGSHKSADDLDDGFDNFTLELTENDLAESDSENETDSETQNADESDVDDIDLKEEDEKEEENNEPQIKRPRHSHETGKPQEINEVSEEEEEEEGNGPEEEDDEDELSRNSDEESTAEESSEEECAMDDLTDLMPSVNDSTNVSSHEKVRPQSKANAEDKREEIPKAQPPIELDLPFVLSVPDNYESFRNLLQNRSNQQRNVIFERLVKSNHPSLKAGNKKKMLTLAGYVIELVSKGEVTWDSLPVFVLQFNILKEFNKEECLKMMVESLKTQLEDLIKDALPVQGFMFLAWYILVFLRPQGLDVLVPVSRPALSLACCLVTRTHHVTLGLLCCYLLLQDAKNSSILYPEAITYLHTCLKSTTDSNEPSKEKMQKNTNPKNSVRKETAEDFKLHLDFENVEEDEKILYCSVTLLSDFVKIYRKYPQSKIMFRQVQHLISNLKADSYPPTISKEIGELQTLLKVLSSAHLPSLTKTSKKPKALRQYEPSFHTVTVGKSQRGLPAEVQEEQKLLHKYKHEMKGAMRELRRDRVFLANIKLREKALSDEQRMKKVKEIFSSAAAQQGELRSLKRKK